MTTQRTPGPWCMRLAPYWGRASHYIDPPVGSAVAVVLTGEGDAEFIIRACNNHEALLAALEQLVALLARDYITDSLRQEPRGVSPAGEAALLVARDAIARARGG